MKLSNDLHLCNNELIEKITFNNGMQDFFLSTVLHKINSYCNKYGIDSLDYNTFVSTKDLLKL